MVTVVSDIDVAVRGHGNAKRPIELPVACAKAPEAAEQRAIAIEHLDAVPAQGYDRSRRAPDYSLTSACTLERTSNDKNFRRANHPTVFEAILHLTSS